MSLVIAALVFLCASCGESSQADVAVKNWLEEREAAMPLTPAEQQFRANMLLTDVKRVIYRDETGADIPYDTFAAVIADGSRSFRKIAEPDNSLAVVSLNAAGAAPSVERLAEEPLAMAIGSAMPPLDNADLSGQKHALDNGTHHTLLFFNFAECIPCVHEVPQLNALHGRSAALQLVSVSFDDNVKAQRIITEQGLKIPVVADGQAYLDTLGLKTFPTLVLVSPQGRLLGARTSFKTGRTPEAGLKDLQDWLASLGVQS